jgi:hypothetical protein
MCCAPRSRGWWRTDHPRPIGRKSVRSSNLGLPVLWTIGRKSVRSSNRFGQF